MDELIKKYPWVLTLKNIVIGVAIVAGLAYFIWISAQQAKQNLQTIFSEEKSDVTVIEEVMARGYDFEEEIEYGEKRQYFGKVWELESKTVEEGQEGAETIAKEIKILRIYKEGKLNLTGIGDKAIYNKNREELQLIGNVHLESEDGSTSLETQKLIWHDTEGNREMSCPTPIEIWVDDNHILADMMFSDKDLEQVDLLGRVSMFNTGLTRENFVTKEGWIEYEDIQSDTERDPDDIINVECEYLFFNKMEKYMECYPRIPHSVRKKHRGYLMREDFQPKIPLKYENGEEAESEEDLLSESMGTTRTEGFEGVFEKKDKPEGETAKTGEVKSGDKPKQETQAETEEPEIKYDEYGNEIIPPPDRVLRASPIPEPFPGKFPERLETQVYCWKQDKKIFSDRLDISLRDKMLKPRFNVYIWAFQLEKEVKKKHDREDEDPSKTIKALAKETTEMYGDFINLYWKTDFVDSWGGVEVRQKDKLYKSENLVYSDELAVMEADGEVSMEQFDGAWLEREGLLEDMTDEKAKEDAKKPTKVNASAMISYDSEDYIYMIGNVFIQQEDQNVLADECEYSDKDDIMIFTGRVKYRNKDGERLDAYKLTLFTEENKYIAEGAVKARSLVPEEYEDDLEELEDEEPEKPADKNKSVDEVKASD